MSTHQNLNIFCNRVSLEEMLYTQFVNAGLLCVKYNQYH